MKSVEKIEELSKEELYKLLKIYAKNWLAHDGCWFLSLEEKYGMKTAIEIDTKSWEKYLSDNMAQYQQQMAQARQAVMQKQSDEL